MHEREGERKRASVCECMGVRYICCCSSRWRCILFSAVERAGEGAEWGRASIADSAGYWLPPNDIQMHNCCHCAAAAVVAVVVAVGPGSCCLSVSMLKHPDPVLRSLSLNFRSNGVKNSILVGLR